MELQVEIKISPRIRSVLTETPAEFRRGLYSVGANALKVGLRRYLGRQAQIRHFTAARLGGVPTGHIEKGTARITSHSTEDGASVLVPIAGITRAFRDLRIGAVKSNALTIPVSGAAYGHTVREMQRMGWNIFRPRGKNFLMGAREDSKEAEVLYLLRKQVVVRQDRSLLPSDEQIAATINNAMALHLGRRDAA